MTSFTTLYYTVFIIILFFRLTSKFCFSTEQNSINNEVDDTTTITDIFEREWNYVIQSTLLNDNTRNGYLLRTEERAVYRFVQRITQQALFVTEKKKIQIEKKNIEKKIQKEKIEMEEDITREVLEEMMPMEDQIVAEILNDVDENRNDTAATSLTNMNMDSEENVDLEEENNINAGDPGK